MSKNRGFLVDNVLIFVYKITHFAKRNVKLDIVSIRPTNGLAVGCFHLYIYSQF